jgi:hypothetical protein
MARFLTSTASVAVGRSTLGPDTFRATTRTVLLVHTCPATCTKRLLVGSEAMHRSSCRPLETETSNRCSGPGARFGRVGVPLEMAGAVAGEWG